MGAAFGSGSSGSLFGAAGSANFLSRTTAILAAIFFASSLGLTWFATTRTAPSGVMQKGVMEKLAPKTSDVPSAPARRRARAGTRAGARRIRCCEGARRRPRRTARSRRSAEVARRRQRSDWQRSDSGRKWKPGEQMTENRSERNRPTW